MAAGFEVSGVVLDLEGGTGPPGTGGEIAEQLEEPSAAGEFGIEEVGGGGHRGDDLGGEVEGAFLGESEVVPAGVFLAFKPGPESLIDEGAALRIVILAAHREGEAPGEAEFGGGEGLAGRNVGEEPAAGAGVDRDASDPFRLGEPACFPVLVEGKHGALENGARTTDPGDAAHR